MLDRRLPAVCDCWVTNACHAACDFCGSSRDNKLAGPARLAISIDSDRLTEHERNRGLEGLTGRIAEGITRAHALGIPVLRQSP
jgi:MoaA/NifB/PqqE/SkfB family radical SAM enzyme